MEPGLLVDSLAPLIVMKGKNIQVYMTYFILIYLRLIVKQVIPIYIYHF